MSDKDSVIELEERGFQSINGHGHKYTATYPSKKFQARNALPAGWAEKDILEQ